MKKLIVLLWAFVVTISCTFTAIATSEIELDLKRIPTENYLQYGMLRAYQDGKLLWEKKTNTGHLTETETISDPYTIDDTVCIVAGDTLYAYDLASGNLKWSLSNMGAGNSMVSDKYGNLYISGYYGPNFAVVNKNGQEIYRNHSDDWGWVYKLQISSDTLIVDYGLDPFGNGYATKTFDISQFKPVTVELNGKNIEFDQLPVVKDGRTLVPIRAVIEAMGGTVSWNQSTKTVTLKLGNNEIELVVGSSKAYLNGQEHTLDVPPQVINDRTLLPIRFVAEGFDFDVDWNGDSKTVIITK